MTIHSDDVCPKCTFELTPERVCDRDYCPNAFMKRTGKALSLEQVMQQFDHQFERRPVEDIDVSQFAVPDDKGDVSLRLTVPLLVPKEPLSQPFMLAEDVRVDPRRRFFHGRTDRIEIEPDAASWVAWAEKSGTIKPAIAELLRAAITKPEAEQTDGDVTHVLLTVEQATWLLRHLPYIRYALTSVYGASAKARIPDELAKLDEIEQALTDRED